MQDKLTDHSTVGNSTSHGEAAPKKRTGIYMLLFLIALGGLGYYVWRSTAKTQAAGRNGGGQNNFGGRGVPVVVAKAYEQDLPITLDGLGTVTAFNTVTVKSNINGEIMEVDFKEGQDVKKGDLLAVVDPRPYQVSLAQAQAALARDTAQLSDAKLNDQRYQQLVKDGVIPQQQYDTQHALAAQLTGAVAGDQAAIDSAKLNLVYSRIISPIDGRVGLRLVDQGNIVHTADTTGMLVITQLEPISLIFTLPEDSLQAVKAGMQKGTLQVTAMTRDASQVIAKGTLLTIDNEIDQTTGTYKLKATFDNKDRALWPNEFVNARLLLETQKNALVVPAAAVNRSSDGTFVYRVKSDKTVEAEPVVIGVNTGNISSVKSGLALGDAVVTEGQDRLRAGMNVDTRAQDAANGNAADDSDSGGSANGNGGGKRNGNGGQFRKNGQQQGGGNAADADSGSGQGSQGGQGQRRNGQGGNGGQGAFNRQGGNGNGYQGKNGQGGFNKKRNGGGQGDKGGQ